eukprot:COSAG02_NODE_4578_length_5200_cov_2.867673_2_plen_584_part_00
MKYASPAQYYVVPASPSVALADLVPLPAVASPRSTAKAREFLKLLDPPLELSEELTVVEVVKKLLTFHCVTVHNDYNNQIDELSDVQLARDGSAHGETAKTIARGYVAKKCAERIAVQAMKLSLESPKQTEPDQKSDFPSIERLIFLQKKTTDAKKAHDRARFNLSDQSEESPGLVKKLRKAERRRLSELRQISQKLDEEMKFLCNRWPAHEYPELYNNEHSTRLKRFMVMNGLVPNGVPYYKNIADALIFYSEWKRVQGPARHELYFAVLDGEKFALKAHSNLDSDNQKLLEERMLLIHSLQHPNIISILAVIVCEEEGSSLRKLLVQMPQYEQNLKSWLQMHLVDAPAELQTERRYRMAACANVPDPHSSLQTWAGPVATRNQLLLGVLQGIKCVHQQGLVHNNVKLDNILLSESREAVLSDFDARLHLDTRVTASTTGTMLQAYAAPELQPRPGRPKLNPSFASDMYSIGVVLMVAFAPETIEEVELGYGDTAARNIATFQRSSSKLPGELQRSVRRLLGREVENRPTAPQMLLNEPFVGPPEGVPVMTPSRWCLCLASAASSQAGIEPGPEQEPEPEPN